MLNYFLLSLFLLRHFQSGRGQQQSSSWAHEFRSRGEDGWSVADGHRDGGDVRTVRGGYAFAAAASTGHLAGVQCREAARLQGGLRLLSELHEV